MCVQHSFVDALKDTTSTVLDVRQTIVLLQVEFNQKITLPKIRSFLIEGVSIVHLLELLENILPWLS